MGFTFGKMINFLIFTLILKFIYDSKDNFIKFIADLNRPAPTLMDIVQEKFSFENSFYTIDCTRCHIAIAACIMGLFISAFFWRKIVVTDRVDTLRIRNYRERNFESLDRTIQLLENKMESVRQAINNFPSVLDLMTAGMEEINQGLDTPRRVIEGCYEEVPLNPAQERAANNIRNIRRRMRNVFARDPNCALRVFAIHLRHSTPPNHRVTLPNHSVTLPNHSVTPPNHSVTPPNHSVTPPNHSVTPPNHSVTPPNQSVTPQQHSVTPPNHSVLASNGIANTLCEQCA